MTKKIVTLLLTAALLAGLVLPAQAEPFSQPIRSYTPGQFSDVGLAAWYTPYVAQVYELGLMQGNTAGAFCPGGSVTIAETATLAARIHKLYETGDSSFPESRPWYQAYVDYALGTGLLRTEHEDYNAPASRSEFAAILSRTLPASELPELNAVEDGQIPDVPMTAENAAEIYLLYRAGILAGNDAAGTFAPDSQIRRSEVAAIAARLADPDARIQRQLGGTYPDPPAGPAVDDEAFVNSAMLGNSLAQGMMLSSGIKNMQFFCYQSTTVYDPNGASPDRCYDRFLRGQFDRVYIEYGINEFGKSKEDFIAAYRKILDRIREVMPEAEIYIMSITPVTQKRSNGGVFTMQKIREYNDALRALAKDAECWYLDACTPLCDSSGYLPEKLGGWDGSPHLAVEGYKLWADVIRTHCVQ